MAFLKVNINKVGVKSVLLTISYIHKDLTEYSNSVGTQYVCGWMKYLCAYVANVHVGGGPAPIGWVWVSCSQTDVGIYS